MATCRVCGGRVSEADEHEYPGLVCDFCDQRAVDLEGRPASANSYGEGSNPIIINGVLCWRRYRFGGWVTRRDDVGAASVEEFEEFCHGLHLTDQVSMLLEQSEPITGCVSPDKGRSKKYRGAVVEYSGQPWVLASTELVSANAQLLDATLNYRIRRGAKYALAYLRPPEGGGRDHAVDDYYERFRCAVWHGLGIAWTTESHPEWKVSPASPPSHSAMLNIVKARFLARLGRVDKAQLSRSDKDAEAVVIPVMNEVLTELGYAEVLDKSYDTFYRKAVSDGLWARESGTPVSLALEVKLNEDGGAPFTQIFDNLGRADSAIQVRLVKPEQREQLDKFHQRNPWVQPLKAHLEERLPVRFIEVDV